MAKHPREKHEEMTRAKHREEAAAAASAEVKTVKTEVETKIAALTKSNDELKAQVTASQERELKSLATHKVEEAIKDGLLSPAQRAWAVALCMKSPDDFAEYLKNAVKMPTGIENFEAERKIGSVVLSAQEIEIATNTNVPLEEYAAMKEKTANGKGLAVMVASR